MSILGRIDLGREPLCVFLDVRLLGIVWLAVSVACFAEEPFPGPLPILDGPAESARSYDVPERYEVAGAALPSVGSSTRFLRSGHAAPRSQPLQSFDEPGMLTGETFGELPAERQYLTPELAAYRDPLRASGETLQVSPELAASMTNFESSTIGTREGPWKLQLLPDGLIYRSYLAGAKESRIGCTVVHEHKLGWIWDISLGGRMGVLRWGTEDTDRPEGWQIDLEGAGLPRLDFENHRDLTAVDFRFGVPVTYGRGRYQTKLAYYHLSSHLGDEYMVRHATLTRKNYARDVIVWGHSFFLTDDIRLYAEAGCAFFSLDGSEPWEFQFGVDYSPVRPQRRQGSPFFAINGHLREEADFGGNLVVQTGWQWRGDSGHLFRLGMQYYSGMSDQFEFYDQYEDKLGFGLWYDF